MNKNPNNLDLSQCGTEVVFENSSVSTSLVQRDFQDRDRLPNLSLFSAQAVAPRLQWRLPPPAYVAPSPPSSWPQAVAPRPLWRLPPPASVVDPGPVKWFVFLMRPNHFNTFPVRKFF